MTTGATGGEFPVDAVIPGILDALRTSGSAVLVAQPGAGKTTRVPPALLDQSWALGKRIIVVEPRRLAARLPAAFMALSMGEDVGRTVGYRVRLDSKVSAVTRIELVTAGVFVRMIVDDPELSGIAAVLFDEAHERALDSDLGLALAIDAKAGLRNDLRLAVMSATIDSARYSGLLGNAPVIESEGRVHPVETVYLGASRQRRLEEQVAAAVHRGLGATQAGILVFLPGQAEIRRTADLLLGRLPETVDLAMLFSAMELKEQDRAIRPAGPGRRKVVLSTSIAETSLTIDDIGLVIDAGLSRRPRFDPGSGLTRLETVRVSRAAADQRRGRAGRTGPGLCYRLWDEPQTMALQPYDRPEMLEADLSSLALALLAWGITDAGRLTWLDPPPPAAFAQALDLLDRIGARDRTGGLSAHGKILLDFPLSPRLAHMMVEAAPGSAVLAGEIAALVSETALGGRDVNLVNRLGHFRTDRSRRASAARAAARRWATLAEKSGSSDRTLSPGLCLALAYPERIARRRGARGRYLTVAGRGAFLDVADSLADSEFLVIADIQGGGADGRVVLAAPVERAEIEERFAGELTTEILTQFDQQTGKVKRTRSVRFGAIAISGVRLPVEPDDETVAVLKDAVLAAGIDSLPWSDDLLALRNRIAFARRHVGADWPDLSDNGLRAKADQWLLPLMADRTGIGGINANDLKQAISGLLPWAEMRALDRLVPGRFEVQTGQSVPIDYSGERPVVRVRAQALFGLNHHPCVLDGKEPLLVELLSPADRPIQLTADLPSFWRGAWTDVRADMRGRYPKHDWPEDPANAEPQRGAKRRPRS